MDDASDRANRWAIGLGVLVLVPTALGTMLSSAMMGFATSSCSLERPCDLGLANAGMSVGFFGSLGIAVLSIGALVLKVGSRGLDGWIPWAGTGLIVLVGMAAQMMTYAAT